MKKPVAFISYAHRDDWDKRLTRLRKSLNQQVSVRTGEDFDIFQDRDDILWGENWKERIEDSLDQVTFLIPIVTPSFFNSSHCRDELQRFLDREKRLGRNDLILPIYYVDTELLNDEVRREKDELARAIHAHQYADWRELRDKSFASEKVRATLGQLATQIYTALERVQGSQIQAESPLGDVSSKGSGIKIRCVKDYYRAAYTPKCIVESDDSKEVFTLSWERPTVVPLEPAVHYRITAYCDVPLGSSGYVSIECYVGENTVLQYTYEPSIGEGYRPSQLIWGA